MHSTQNQEPNVHQFYLKERFKKDNSFPWFIDWLFGLLNVLKVDQCFPVPRMMSSNALICPKDIQFTVKEEETNQNILYIREANAEDRWRNKKASKISRHTCCPLFVSTSVKVSFVVILRAGLLSLQPAMLSLT